MDTLGNLQLSDLPNEILSHVLIDHLWDYFPVLREVCSKWEKLCDNAADSGIPLQHGPRTVHVLGLVDSPDLVEWALDCVGDKAELYGYHQVEILRVASSAGNLETVKFLTQALEKSPCILRTYTNEQICQYSEKANGTSVPTKTMEAIDHWKIAARAAALAGHCDVLDYVTTRTHKAYFHTIVWSALAGGHVDLAKCYNDGNNLAVIDSTTTKSCAKLAPDTFTRALCSGDFSRGSCEKYISPILRACVKVRNVELLDFLVKTFERAINADIIEDLAMSIGCYRTLQIFRLVDNLRIKLRVPIRQHNLRAAVLGRNADVLCEIASKWPLHTVFDYGLAKCLRYAIKSNVIKSFVALRDLVPNAHEVLRDWRHLISDHGYIEEWCKDHIG